MTVQNQTLGRGKLYFDQFAAGTENTTGELYLGNTLTCGITLTTQDVVHYDSDAAVKVMNDSATLSVDFKGVFETDNVSLDNLALFFFGAKSLVTQAALTAQAETLPVKVDRFYQLGTTAANLAGLQNLTSLTVKNVGDVTTYVAGVDYTIDLVLGRLYIIPGGAITDGQIIHLLYDVAVHTHDLVISGKQIIYGGLRFVSDNARGTNKTYYMGKVALRPNGEFVLKADDWQKMSFNIDILQKNGAAPHVLVNGRPLTA